MWLFSPINLLHVNLLDNSEELKRVEIKLVVLPPANIKKFGGMLNTKSPLRESQ